MAKEIEHKFLVRTDLLPHKLPAGKRLVQGYLSSDPAVRVRIASDARGAKAFLTIKGKGLRVRDEFEYEVPVADARAMLKLCGRMTLEKIRRVIGRWELDEFKGRHKGLWMAEYELKSARERLPELPEWIGREVTGDSRFTNVRLCAQSFDKTIFSE